MMKAPILLFVAAATFAAAQDCADIKSPEFCAKKKRKNKCTTAAGMWCRKTCGICTPPAPAAVGECATAMEAPIPGIMGSKKRPHFIMGMDIDYPPYAYIKTAPYGSATDTDSVVGVGADMIKAMGRYCGFDVTITQAAWGDCWGAGVIGAGLREGWYHGCMTYTHAAGVRNRFLDFTNSWAIKNKPSGLIVKLVNGKPKLSPQDDLNGKTIVDVTGWAPTADTLYFVKNQCTQQPYTGFTVIQGDSVTGLVGTAKGPNDAALMAVLQDKADAMWIYGDQAYNYKCKTGETQPGWDCAMWGKFGTDFAYIQSGMFAWMHNGTTVAISKKGSGINEILDPCLDKFMQTKQFYEVCAKMHGNPPHNQLSTCVPNDYIKADPTFKALTPSHDPYMFGTSAMKAAGHSCSTGYCNCDEQP